MDTKLLYGQMSGTATSELRHAQRECPWACGPSKWMKTGEMGTSTSGVLHPIVSVSPPLQSGLGMGIPQPNPDRQEGDSILQGSRDTLRGTFLSPHQSKKQLR